MIRSGEEMPKLGALEGVTQFDVYDEYEKVIFPADDGGFVYYYPDSDFLYARQNAEERDFVEYNLRTKDAQTEYGATDEAKQQLIEFALSTATAHGIDPEAITQGYPEVDAIIEQYVVPEAGIEVEDMDRPEHTGKWFFLKATDHAPVGTIENYTLFKFDRVVEETPIPREEYLVVYAQPLGAPLPHDASIPYGLEVRDDRPVRDTWPYGGTKYPLKLQAAGLGTINDGRLLIPKDKDKRTGRMLGHELTFFGVDDEAAEAIVRLRVPEIDSAEACAGEREYSALNVALHGLQYARWSKWQLVEEYQQRIERRPDSDRAKIYEGYLARIDQMDYENYEQAITSLAERFGEGYLKEVAWDVMSAHLQRVHSEEITPGLGYKAHADVSPYPRAWMDTAAVLTSGAHPLPESMTESGHVVNAMPLYADADFWRVLQNNYPETFTDLSQRFLDLSEDLECAGIYGVSTVNPRALLRDHFPETYTLLTDHSKRFTAELGSIAIQPHGRN